MDPADLELCDVRDATHVKVNGHIVSIKSKWGVMGRQLAKPSEGGFGVVTEDGRRVDMWQAESYYKKGDGR